MSDVGWLSVLPPIAAIVLAVWTRQVYLSLFAGVWIGWTALHGWNPLAGLAGAVDGTVSVVTDPGNANVVVFVLGIGSLIATFEKTGGVGAFVRSLDGRGWVDTPRKARGLSWLIGIAIFIESSITVLVAGAVSRPLFDRFRISREKLAYLIDSTSAAVCILIPLNAWGAYNLALLSAVGVPDPLGTFVRAVPMNLYAIAAVILAGVTAWGLDIGPMRAAEERTRSGALHWPNARPLTEDVGGGALPEVAERGHPIDMALPILVLVGMVPVGLWVTGNGDITAGDGSRSVLWGVLASLAAAWALSLARGRLDVDRLIRMALKGAGGMLPLALVLVLSLSLGSVAGELGTGEYLAGAVRGVLPPPLLLPLVFLIGAGTAFATGTSWGTFAILVPVAVPIALSLGLPPAPFLAAALSGGIFGDHSSPISDTTIIASMAAGTDHIAHVRTQLPYALVAGGVAAIGFVGIGMTL